MNKGNSFPLVSFGQVDTSNPVPILSSGDLISYSHALPFTKMLYSVEADQFISSGLLQSILMAGSWCLSVGRWERIKHKVIDLVL